VCFSQSLAFRFALFKISTLKKPTNAMAQHKETVMGNKDRTEEHEQQRTR
jgi:hypothetical protein